MKYTLISTVNGEAVHEEAIEIMPGDRIIATFNTSSVNMTAEYVNSMSKYIAEVLENDCKIISTPDFVSFKVLRINE